MGVNLIPMAIEMVHLKIACRIRRAQQYVQDRVSDPRGTGGTPYVEWLRQLIEETCAWRL